MSKETFYRQCVLNRKGTGTVSWIPERFAEVGKVIKLKRKRDNKWEDGWNVKVVGKTRMSEEKMEGLSRQHLWTREVSDI